MASLEIAFRTGKITIDQGKCSACRGLPCVKACSLFGRGLFRIQDGKVALIGSVDDAQKSCIECLACERYCADYGKGGLTITLDTFGLEDYRRKVKLTPGAERK